jgi:uncharacterized Fe-S center protein
MGKSKVYFTDMRTKPGLSLLDKLERLIRTAGIDGIKCEDKFVALKIHFGEPGNLAFLRPNYAAKVAAIIKALGGRPYLTDSGTLYTGMRANALDHLEAAAQNGYTPMTVGCPIVIADGLKGTDYREIEINQKRCRTAKIGTYIADADVVVSVTHFKGHEMTGFGGALKNLGMGSGSRGGKLEMHSASQPRIVAENCVACGQCIRYCAQEAIAFNEDKKAEIDYGKCVGCGQCVAVCRFDAAQVIWNEAADTLNEKIAEYAYAVVKDKPSFHISFVMDVSPNCDCWDSNDVPIVPDIGIACSFDPVALDRACVDLVNAAPVMGNSDLAEAGAKKDDDKFTCVHRDTDWRVGLAHGEAIGLGTQEYELVRL